MLGTIGYVNEPRGFVLVTPAGKARSHDLYARLIHFLVAGISEPELGMIVEFCTAPNPAGRLEVINIRAPQLQPPPGYDSRKAEVEAGAAPAAVETAAAGTCTPRRP